MGKQSQPCITIALYCDICGWLHGPVECTSSPSENYERVDTVGYQQCPQGQCYNNYGGNQGWKQESGWTNQNHGG